MKGYIGTSHSADPSVELSVIIPVYNEIHNIRPLLLEILNAFGTLIRHEVIVVDDGSNDGTCDLLEKLVLQFASLRFIRHTCNLGQSAAICTGISIASGEIIATLDGDGQNDPADILKLLNSYKAECEINEYPPLIIGCRIKRQDTWLRRFSSRIANAVRSLLLKDRTYDTGCGVKVFSRHAFQKLPKFDHMHRFLPALFIRNNSKVISIEVNHRQRWHGTSKYGVRNRLWIGILDLFGVIWLRRRPDYSMLKKRMHYD